MLTLNHEKKGLIDIITLEGILNADTSPNLESVLQPLTETECPRILINLPDLTYISSAGIGCFIGVIKRIREKGGDIKFSMITSKVKRVFSLLDMDEFFKFYLSLDEGIESFNS